MSNTKSRQALRAAQTGFSMIEVMVSILIFAFGVLGLVGLQVQATRISEDADDRNRASLMANELVSEMWAAQSVTVDTTSWSKRVSDEANGGLHNGAGTVTTSTDTAGAVTATIEITWTTIARGADGPSGRYVTQVVLPGVSS
jgi:type IV pilus assembly protein PilV